MLHGIAPNQTLLHVLLVFTVALRTVGISASLVCLQVALPPYLLTPIPTPTSPILRRVSGQGFHQYTCVLQLLCMQLWQLLETRMINQRQPAMAS